MAERAELARPDVGEARVCFCGDSELVPDEELRIVITVGAEEVSKGRAPAEEVTTKRKA